jgi:DNA polymerase sigma
MVKTYVALDPRVRPLIMIIKHWSKQRLLNDAGNNQLGWKKRKRKLISVLANGGTLSSYTWTCMIINFLQTRNPPILPVLHAVDGDRGDDHFCDNIERLRGFGADNQETLGGLLYAFFRRFAIEFDYNQQVISVRQGRCLLKREKGWDMGRYKSSLCVEEPFNVSRNLGNSADQASVQGLWMEFHRFLDLLLNKADFDQLFTPFQPFIVAEPLFHKDVLSLTLPSENRSGYLPSHPYDRRRSMVDGIYTYPPTLFSDHIAHRPKDPFLNFHPRFSSPQALDTILKIRNTRHGSHPLISVPNLLLSTKSVDNILARYQKKPRHKRQFKRQSSQEWPSISTKPNKEPIVINQPLRRRRWSTTTDIVKPEPEIPKKTLAEIVKIGTASKPPIKMPKPPAEKTRRRHRNKSQNKQKKKTVKK